MIIKDFKVPESINEPLKIAVSLQVFRYLYGILKNSRQALSYSQRTDYKHLYVIDAIKTYILIYLVTEQFKEKASKFNFTKNFFSGYISEGRYKTIKKALSEEKGIIKCELSLTKDDNEQWNTITHYSIPKYSKVTEKIEEISNQDNDLKEIEIKLSEKALKFFND